MLPIRGDLFFYPRCSIKFKVLPNILQAIQAEFKGLVVRSWDADQVHVRSYPPKGTEKFAKVRVYGQNTEAVMKVKGAFQTMLEGVPAVAK